MPVVAEVYEEAVTELGAPQVKCVGVVEGDPAQRVGVGGDPQSAAVVGDRVVPVISAEVDVEITADGCAAGRLGLTGQRGDVVGSPRWCLRALSS